jgi:hypothetical protein
MAKLRTAALWASGVPAAIKQRSLVLPSPSVHQKRTRPFVVVVIF